MIDNTLSSKHLGISKACLSVRANTHSDPPLTTLTERGVEEQ